MLVWDEKMKYFSNRDQLLLYVLRYFDSNQKYSVFVKVDGKYVFLTNKLDKGTELDKKVKSDKE